MKDNHLLKESLFFSNAALHRLLSLAAEEAFQDMNLAVSHACILLVLFEEKELSASEISEFMFLAPSTITRLLDGLESKNLIKRRKTGRLVMITATHQARAIEKKLNARWTYFNEVVAERLGQSLNQKLANALYETSRLIKSET